MFVFINATHIANIYPGDILDSGEDLVEVPSEVTDMKFGGGFAIVTFANGATRKIMAAAAVKVYEKV